MSGHEREGSAQHELIVREARTRGIDLVEVEMDDGLRGALLTLGDIEELVVQGIPRRWINEKAVRYCDHKQLTKELFSEVNIPFPFSIRFERVEDLNPEIFDGNRTFICKPEVGTNGKGVTFDVQSMDDVRAYYNTIGAGKVSLLEEFVEGHDLRVQVIGRRSVAACVRKPAFVVGNGIDTLENLIAMRQEEINRQNPSNQLIVDEQTMDLISAAGFTRSSVIPKDVSVQLKRIANIGQGGIAEDCTDRIDPRLQDWVTALSEALQTPYFAVDIITNDISDLTAYTALELNLQAEWMHHTFSQGRTHDLAKLVVDELFGKAPR